MVISVKLIYVLNSFHMLFLSILYPYLCKTNKISSKLGFVGLLIESNDLARNEQLVSKMKVNRVYHINLSRHIEICSDT